MLCLQCHLHSQTRWISTMWWRSALKIISRNLTAEFSDLLMSGCKQGCAAYRNDKHTWMDVPILPYLLYIHLLLLWSAVNLSAAFTSPVSKSSGSNSPGLYRCWAAAAGNWRLSHKKMIKICNENCRTRGTNAYLQAEGICHELSLVVWLVERWNKRKLRHGVVN